MQSVIATFRKRPSECQPDELAAFKAIVVAGGQVQRRGLDALIYAAEWLGFSFKDGTLLSVAALKNPRPEHRMTVFEKAKSKEQAEQFSLEYGWAHTLEGDEGQGFGSKIADTLLEGVGSSLYATTGVTNEVMKHILMKREFKISGQPYRGRNEAKILFIRRIGVPNLAGRLRVGLRVSLLDS